MNDSMVILFAAAAALALAWAVREWQRRAYLEHGMVGALPARLAVDRLGWRNHITLLHHPYVLCFNALARAGHPALSPCRPSLSPQSLAFLHAIKAIFGYQRYQPILATLAG
jgi:hypothetical protein